MTTRVLSVSVPVADQDRALRFYTEVLGCEVRIDTEIWPGARLIEVVPPGSRVGILLLPPDGGIPVAVRLGTSDAQAAYDTLCGARDESTGTATMYNDEVLRLEGMPPMFYFADPDGNGLVYLQEDEADG